MNYNIHSLSKDEKIKLVEELWKVTKLNMQPHYLLLNNKYWKNEFFCINKTLQPGKSWKEIRKKYLQ